MTNRVYTAWYSSLPGARACDSLAIVRIGSESGLVWFLELPTSSFITFALTSLLSFNFILPFLAVACLLSGLTAVFAVTAAVPLTGDCSIARLFPRNHLRAQKGEYIWKLLQRCAESIESVVR